MPNLHQQMLSDIITPDILRADACAQGNAVDHHPGPQEFDGASYPGYHFSRALRMHRLFRHGSKLVVVPLDHSVTDGPIVRRGRSIDQLVRDLAASQVDAIVLHKGSLRHIRHTRFGAMSLIIHLSASSHHAPDPDAKCLVTSVEEALALGADAVSVHINLGSPDERRQIADLGAVAGSCDKWNTPLIAMVYPRGPEIANPHDPELVAHAAILAADLGADIVKTVYPGSRACMAEVTAACPIPVIVAGGSRMESAEQVLDFVTDALLGGAAGVAIGRNVFTAPNPRAMAGRVTRAVRQLSVAPRGRLGDGEAEKTTAEKALDETVLD
ncbi:MAG TPA: 2-amino-3,7-dideoxy-D-threo-hept-6-ulosonate synthase [Streptosporangiaceae bacterium]